MKKYFIQFKDSFKIDSFLIIFSSFSILPFILISYFNNPASDDFSYNTKSQSIGFWEAQSYWYNDWSGRYLASAILSITELLSQPFIIYKILPILLLGSLFFSLYYLASIVLPDLTKKDYSVISLYFITIYIVQLPTIPQGFYWLAGSVTYQLANILSVLFLCFLIKLLKHKKNKYLITTSMLIAAIIGLNETSMLIIDYVLAIIFSYHFFINKKINPQLILLLLIAVLFSLIVILAPGNAIRAAHFPNNHRFFYSIARTGIEVLLRIGKWFPLVFIYSVVFYFYIKNKVTHKNNLFISINFSILIGSILSIICIGIFPSFWSMGMPAPNRTFNVIYFFFLIGSIYLTLNSIKYPPKFLITKLKSITIFSKKSPLTTKMILIVFVLGNTVGRNNIKTAYTDLLTGKAHNYNTELTNRYALISNCLDETCKLPELEHKPKTIFSDDITTDPKDWRNEAYSKYFKKKNIILKNKQ